MSSVQIQIIILRQTNQAVLMSLKVLSVLTVCITCVLFASNLYAKSQEYYRWTDKAGVTHYGLNPPENSLSTKILIDTHQPKLEPNKSELKHTQDEQGVDENEVNRIKAQRQKQCDAERERISWLERKRLKRVREDGRLRILTRDDVAQRLAEAKKLIREACQ
ncbi:DUF4124 domain-containing protein [Teredinibacter turnerae]|uniref:DUF4124 domain-containing protein n=1 Tax=Teredinibacter turnerae TaxID=2426 RepID=UPI00037ADE37|nr:DUF4124 domain-containing protein [Teredinibacter turnerae]